MWKVTRWRNWLRHYAKSRKVAGSIPSGVTDLILPAALWPCGDSTSNRNEYQEYFLGCKGGRCVGLTTLPPSCADCIEILVASTFYSFQVLSRAVMDLLYFTQYEGEWVWYIKCLFRVSVLFDTADNSFCCGAEVRFLEFHVCQSV
jgi:hypothetical protein